MASLAFCGSVLSSLFFFSLKQKIIPKNHTQNFTAKRSYIITKTKHVENLFSWIQTLWLQQLWGLIVLLNRWYFSAPILIQYSVQLGKIGNHTTFQLYKLSEIILVSCLEVSNLLFVKGTIRMLIQTWTKWARADYM